MSGITDETLRAAEAIMGIGYTPAERALLLETIESQIATARLRRQTAFPNELPMALTFDPRLPGFDGMPPEDRQIFSAVDPVPLPGDEEDIAFAPVTRLSSWIRAGALTSRRLTEIYLARIEAHGPRLACFATVTADLARRQADEADAMLSDGKWLGPLHGIPYGAKDLFDTAGVPTEWGAEPYRGRTPVRDAVVIERLRAAGAVLLGKTTLGALAYGDIWYGGQTRNPWNLEEGSSGSSAGSAAAAAAGLCGFALGTETLGSITSPSQRCGTTGLRPTFGRVGRTGAMALCWSLDKIGPICRSVEDCAIVLAAINGPDPADRASIAAPFAFDARAPVAGMRVGHLPETFEPPGATEVDRAALAAARRLGAEVVAVRLPDLPYGALMHILYAEAAAAFEDLTLSGRDDLLTLQEAEAWPNIFRRARFLSAVDHVQADRLRYQVMQVLDAVFRDVDAMIGPFATGPMLIASNFTGHPCLHLRAGFVQTPTRRDTSASLAPSRGGRLHTVPQGISLWGRLFDEGRLCRLGRALEAELNVAHIVPRLSA